MPKKPPEPLNWPKNTPSASSLHDGGATTNVAADKKAVRRDKLASLWLGAALGLVFISFGSVYVYSRIAENNHNLAAAYTLDAARLAQYQAFDEFGPIGSAERDANTSNQVVAAQTAAALFEQRASDNTAWAIFWASTGAVSAVVATMRAVQRSVRFGGPLRQENYFRYLRLQSQKPKKIRKLHRQQINLQADRVIAWNNWWDAQHENRGSI